MINVFEPSFTHTEVEAVERVLDSKWVGRGKITDQFEASFAHHLGVPKEQVISVLNCTQGLFISMKLLGISHGDEVILPSISFVGAANAVVAAGATPIFCDVNKYTLNPTVDTIERCINAKTQAIMILHYGGVAPRDIDKIAGLADHHAVWLVEDAACSVATKFDDRACGTFGNIGVWSFDPMKILCSVEGGMMYIQGEDSLPLKSFKTPAMIESAKRMAFLGVSSESGITSTSFRWWEFDVDYAEGRYTMNDVFSAVGLSQLKKLPEFINRRHYIWDTYQAILGDRRRFSWLDTPPEPPADSESSYYMYWIQTEHRDKLAHYLKEHGIYTTFRYYPLHLIPFYHSSAKLPNTMYAAERTLCLPIHQGLSDNDVSFICDTIDKFGKEQLL